MSWREQDWCSAVDDDRHRDHVPTAVYGLKKTEGFSKSRAR